jgi:hypothetical protein
MSFIKYILYGSLILLVSVCTNNCIISQDYNKLIEPNKTWNVINYVCGYAPCSWWTNALTFGKDTLINGKKYSEVLEDWRILGDFRPSGHFIREDTLARKTFMLNYTCMDEILLYDFTLEKDDSLLFCDNSDFLLIVDSIKYILVQNETRKCIYFNSDQYGVEEYWIEGIGSNCGLVNSRYYFYLFDAAFQLACVFYQDSLIFQNPNVASCNESNVSIKDIFASRYNALVTYDPLRIVFNNINTSKSILNIYNTNGVLHEQIILDGIKEIEINEGKYEPGLYIFRFQSQNLVLQGKFLIINK